MNQHETLPRTSVFGLDFIADDGYQRLLAEISAKRHQNGTTRLPLLITPNVGQLVFLSRSRSRALYDRLKEALFILPDGQPIVTFSKLLGKRLGKRLTGSDLFPQLWQQVREQRQKVLFILPSEEVEHGLRKEYDQMEAYVPPHFRLQEPEKFRDVADQCLQRIRDYRPDYVMIGLGFPKQEWLSLELIDGLPPDQRPLFMLLGASFEFHTQCKTRAPKFMQRLGLEWFFRFLCEPRRLFARYFFGSFRFLVVLLRQAMGRPFNASTKKPHYQKAEHPA